MYQKPNVLYTDTLSGAKLIRFDSLDDILWYDVPENNPYGIGVRDLRHYEHAINHYLKYRHTITPYKQKIIEEARKNMSLDNEFLELVYKAKSSKREFKLNRFGGNLSMPHYASNSEKIFKKTKPGAKKVTLNLAFQVGTFRGQSYSDSFVKILKTILMCQAMNINVNIDMFDSDTDAIDYGPSYVICNVAKSSEKLNLRKILLCSHKEFFYYTLFNGYSASGKQKSIGTFLREERIIKDLSEKYDVIGGNTLLTSSNIEGDDRQLVSRILKIGLS